MMNDTALNWTRGARDHATSAFEQTDDNDPAKSHLEAAIRHLAAAERAAQ